VSYNLNIIFYLVTLVLILLFLFKLFGKISMVGLSIGKFIILGIAILVVIWGIYNYVGYHFRLWEPMTLDAYINAILDRIPPLERFLEWLNRVLEKYFPLGV